jgi:hypothetical protein
MAASSAKTKEPTQQDVCIDLPGETVQCWRSNDNIKVILRKHRDVIFDLNLGKGKTYTVQATESNFYNARDKKLVYAKRRDAVTFKDGERLHLWVTRSFEGALVLKCGSEILMKLTPNEVDKQQYDDAPKTKPAPIIVALGPSGISKEPPAKTDWAPQPWQTQTKTPVSQAAPIDEECSVICVVEGTVKGMPAIVAKHFEKGGGKSGLADIDPNETATRNWIWGQVVGTVAYVDDNWSWLRASLDSKTHKGFRLVSAKIHLVRGKVRFYFSGFSKYNNVFGPGGFGPGHERVMNIFAGVGKTSSAFASVMKNVGASFRSCALVSFIFGAVTSVAEWKDDVKKDGYDLAAVLLVGVAKAVISALLVAALVALLVMAIMFAGLAAVPVMAIGVLTIGLGIVANYGVEAGDKALGKAVTGDSKNTDGIATTIAPWLRKAGTSIENTWKILVEKYPADYEGISF